MSVYSGLADHQCYGSLHHGGLSLGRVNMAEIATLLGLRGSWLWGEDGPTPLKLVYLKDQQILNEQFEKKNIFISFYHAINFIFTLIHCVSFASTR